MTLPINHPLLLNGNKNMNKNTEIVNMFSLEGPDGSGKTTQLPLIKSSLEGLGLKVRILKSPDVTPLGEFIRSNVQRLDPWLRNNLFMLDINYTLRNLGTPDPSLVLLWDRYIDSFYTSNKEMTLTESLSLVHDLPKPRKTFLLDMDSAYIFTERKETLDQHSEPVWLEQKVNRYRELAALDPERIVKIDARLPIEEVTRRITHGIIQDLNK